MIRIPFEEIWKYTLLYDKIQDDEMCILIENLYDFTLKRRSLAYETIIRHCFKYVKLNYGMRQAYVFINKFDFYVEKYKK